MMKNKYEKKIKTLEDRVNELEGDIKEKDKENKLHAIKIKDIIRSQNDFHKPKKVKKLPNLNGSTIIKSKSPKLFSINQSQSESESKKARNRSIDPQQLRLRTKSKVNTNLK